jgi:hypothetical protein
MTHEISIADVATALVIAAALTVGALGYFDVLFA